MGGGNSKKASDRSEEVERQIIARQQHPQKQELVATVTSPERSNARSKSVAVNQRSTIP